MRRLLLALLWALVSGAEIQAQVEQLATSGDGQILLFHSRFRLQTETDLGPLGKIYRWQNGQWTRLAVAPDIGFAISPPDVFSPFLSNDATVVGWQVYVGCGLCQIVAGPVFWSTISGTTLPASFPRGTLRMSANGRYFTADNYPFPGVTYLDAATGVMTDIPVSQFARPVIREVANDGTALLMTTQPNDPNQYNAPGALSLWKPGSDPRALYSENHAHEPTISANAGRVAFEAVVEGGADDDHRTLTVIDTHSGERLAIADMPQRDFRARTESFAKPVWDANGAKLVYRTYDGQLQPTAISLWDAGTRESRVLLADAEGFASAVISADGNIVWSATTTNRLIRLNLSTGATDELLPPLGSVTRGIDGNGVPGSAVLIRGVGFNRSDVAMDGNVRLPLVDAGPDGLWVQIPWEYAGLPMPQQSHRVLIRSPGNPFEAVLNVGVTSRVEPHFATFIDPVSANEYVKAVHADFQSLVTPASPAHPGEIVHVYLTGLGPLDQPLATGEPGPLEPLAHPLATPVCRLESDDPRPLQMPYLVYAVGMIGIYQAGLRIPDNPPEGATTLRCTTSDANGVFSTSAFITTSSK
jgi:uncharacterized protein (TIGR03437 family)